MVATIIKFVLVSSILLIFAILAAGGACAAAIIQAARFMDMERH